MRCQVQAGAMLLAWVLAGGCNAASTTDSGTTGHTVVFETEVEIKDDLSEPHVNALGWEINLTKAYLSVGALYYYSGSPVLSLQERHPATERGVLEWMGELLLPSAHAHPGHYIEGEAMGQMLSASTIDLLAEDVSLAAGEGVTGAIHSARITWQSPPEGELAAELEGQVVLTEGTASKDGVRVPFIAKADATEAVDGNGEPQVSGCAFGSSPGEVGVQVEGDGTVTLTLVPSVWFDQVDFSYVAPGAEDAPEADEEGNVDLAGTLAWQGFLRGVKKGTAYEFSYEK